MKIGGLQRTTLIDYPGKIAATVFLSGCNFRCPWCYASELVLPEKIKKQPEISKKEFFEFLKTKQKMLDGIVVCGGEPTINKDLPEFIKKIKDLGFAVKLDTNGSNPRMLEDLISQKLIDYIAMDIKGPLDPNFQFSLNSAGITRSKASGLIFNFQTNPNDQISKIKKSIELIKNSGIDYEFRTTVVPTIYTKEDIIQMAKNIAPAKRYFLQNFRPEKTIDPRFERIKPYPEEYLKEILKEISPFFEVCGLR